jgi:hypothetical protein
MKKSQFVVISISLVLTLTVIIAGCTQIPSPGSNVQKTIPTTEQTNCGSQTCPLPTNGVQTGSPGAMTTENAGQPQNTYVVAVTLFRIGSGVSISYQGGQDAASLEYITVSVNGVYQGDIRDPYGQTILPVGTKGTFPANNPGNDNVICVGHFTDGTTQVIAETTL